MSDHYERFQRFNLTPGLPLAGFLGRQPANTREETQASSSRWSPFSSPYAAPLTGLGSDGLLLSSQRVARCVRVYVFAAFYEANGASARNLTRHLPCRHPSPPLWRTTACYVARAAHVNQ